MKTYVMMNNKKFNTVEDAVIEAENLHLESADIDIYTDDGKYIESQTVREDEMYSFIMYAAGRTDTENWEYYHNIEKYYNTAEEAALSVEKKDRKNVRIDAVNQTTNTYFETVEIYTIDELIKE